SAWRITPMIWASVKRSLFIRISSILTLRKFSFKSHSFYGGITRGLDGDLSHEVAVALMKHNALGAHARDELGLSEATAARPIQAAFASATAFSSGALLPVLAAVLTPVAWVSWGVSLTSVVVLAVLGVVGALAGGAAPLRPALRVTFWGIVAMIVTGGIGRLFGV
ncbi:VIT1/CCC1 transporter family protein, partial [Komagataeibacter rhaeticus]|uniref:VIT1/CCC1 transporter family protein n=1 Tax=Komagataeibacter rhaeticus TaxID=215221 RepID=UPI001CD7F77A